VNSADHLSPPLRAAYSQLVSVILWIDEHGKHLDVSADARKQISAACFDMVLEHQAAIATLIEQQLNGSALALLRAAAEGFIRGVWFARCATDSEVQRFQKDQLDKGIRKLVNEVETALGCNSDVLSRMVATQWDTLCSFTHTGFKQVTRRYTGATLQPSYPDVEVTQALNFAAAIGLLAMMELATLSNNAALTQATFDPAQ